MFEEVSLSVKESVTPYGSSQFADYVLLSSGGEPLANVEAKKTSRDDLAGKRQASDYADLIKQKFGFDPFIFLTNGNEIQFWDRVNYPPRTISGYYTRDDLERLLHQRKFAQPLHDIVLDTDIAGRDYQIEAIRRVTEGIQQAKRSFLMVMATGSGKTRTFDCEDGIPSYHYSFSQAVADQHLVNYLVLDAQTSIQIKGIQGDALPEQLQQMAIDQGVPIEELNFEGSDIEKGVINQGTNDAIDS